MSKVLGFVGLVLGVVLTLGAVNLFVYGPDAKVAAIIYGGMVYGTLCAVVSFGLQRFVNFGAGLKRTTLSGAVSAVLVWFGWLAFALVCGYGLPALSTFIAGTCTLFVVGGIAGVVHGIFEKLLR